MVDPAETENDSSELFLVEGVDGNPYYDLEGFDDSEQAWNKFVFYITLRPSYAGLLSTW